jgi:hypothetical protein
MAHMPTVLIARHTWGKMLSWVTGREDVTRQIVAAYWWLSAILVLSVCGSTVLVILGRRRKAPSPRWFKVLTTIAGTNWIPLFCLTELINALSVAIQRDGLVP